MNPRGFKKKSSLALAISAATTLIAGAQIPLSSAVQAQELEEITVTGSRIVRRDLDAPSPIVTVGSENFRNTSSTSVEQVLNQLPQFVPSGTQFGSSVQNSATSTPGAATLNLRGLGDNRNLVLIDGKRAQPANATLVVDINTIPAAAIENVEVITGGASSVYGPDAMAGVVNFILKDNFEGAEFDFQTGQTAEGDGQEDRFSMLLGMNSADGRGNVMFGLDWTKRDSVYQRDRDFYVNGWNDTANPGGDFIMPPAFFPGGNPASQAALDSFFTPGSVNQTTEIYFNQDGSPFVVQNAQGYNGPLNCLDCGDYSLMKVLDNGNLDQRGRSVELLASTPLTRHSVFARGNYDIFENVSAFAQVNYSNVQVDQTGNTPPAITVWQAPAVPNDGRTLPPDLQTLLNSRASNGPDDPWALFHVLDYNGAIEAENKNQVWQFMVGLEGDLRGGDWTWELFGSRGETDIQAVNNNLPSLQRYQQMVYSPNFGQGLDAYVPPQTGDGIGPGRGYSFNCTSGLPIFDDFQISQDCLNSIDTGLVNRNKLGQEILEFNLQGGLGDWFELPAGEVRFAAGYSYRSNSYSFVPGNPSNQTRDNPIGVFANAATGGKINVREWYGELLIPVIDTIDLELGYRQSDFSTAGKQDTYQAMFTWDAADWVTVRGGYQFATRAPNIAELFTAPTQEVVGHPDQDNCSVTTLAPHGNVPGNPDRQQVIDLCRAIIGNNTSGFDTQTYSITGIPGPEGFHRQNPPFFPLEIALRQGNPNVGPETGETITFGGVFTEPLGIENLSITLDYYDIAIADAISPISVQTVYNNCFNFNGTSNPSYDINNPFCQQIRRNPITGDREEVDTPFENLGELETQGIDLGVNWSWDVGPGSLLINSNMNFLDSFEYKDAPDGVLVDATGTLARGGLFEFRAFTTFSYAWSDFNVGVNWRHLGSAEAAAYAESPGTTIQGPGSYDMFNAFGSYNWNNYTIRFGIDNLFDEDPELTQANPGVDSNTDITVPGLYDILGRRYFLGISASF